MVSYLAVARNDGSRTFHGPGEMSGGMSGGISQNIHIPWLTSNMADYPGALVCLVPAHLSDPTLAIRAPKAPCHDSTPRQSRG